MDEQAASTAARWHVLAAAITEAEILTDGASNYLDGLLDTHKRFAAFRREADAARRASVLLRTCHAGACFDLAGGHNPHQGDGTLGA